MTPPETHSIAEIPETLIRSCIEHLWHFTVGFVRVEPSERGVDANLLGSGVLVQGGGVSAILTAAHVVDFLPTSGRLGLILSDKREHTTIDVSGIAYLPIGRGHDPERGPDIGVVLLSDYVASTLEARKSYYNLDLRKERILSSPPDDRAGIWFVQGFVEEMTVLDPNPTPYERVKGFCEFGSLGIVEDYVSSGDHDYYTFPLSISPAGGIPSDFGGCSGGGLWHVLLVEREGGEPAVDQALLQGLTYFQQPTLEGSSALRCHGPRSIYDVAYSAIRQHTP